MYTSIYMQADGRTKAGKAIKAIQKKTKDKAILDKAIVDHRRQPRAIVDKKVLDAKVLDYRPAVTTPRHYGSVTIYTSENPRVWRVKPAPGRRDETTINYSISPRARWATLVKLVKSLKQV